MRQIEGMFEVFPTRLPTRYPPVLAFPPNIIGHLYTGFLSVARFEFSVCCLYERLLRGGGGSRFRQVGVLGGPLELCRSCSFIL